MQDKEFDQLFKDRFEDAAMQPSADLWGRIAEELEPKKKRLSLPLYWLSAAAVAGLALTIGLLSPETETIKLKQEAVAVQVEKPAAGAGLTGDAAEVSPEQNVQAGRTLGTPLVIAARLTAAEVKNNLVAVQPQGPAEHPVERSDDTFTASAAKESATTPATEETVLARIDVPEESTVSQVTETALPEHKGIRNVGDLVNFVVGKVDKRENKIVQFDTDDDNSSLVSLNLGIIRFNKRASK